MTISESAIDASTTVLYALFGVVNQIITDNAHYISQIGDLANERTAPFNLLGTNKIVNHGQEKRRSREAENVGSEAASKVAAESNQNKI